MLFIKLAWRNLWRNRKRTIIATASIFFAVVLAVLMRSLQLGSYEYMVDSAVSLYTGYMQVQDDEYWDNRSLNKSIEYDKELKKEIDDISGVDYSVPRLEGYALISYGDMTRVAQVTGIDPKLENRMAEIKEKISEGEYLTSGGDGFLIGKQLAEIIGAGLGDTVVLYGQGYHGVTAAASVEITGIIDFPVDELSKSVTYLSLQRAQDFYMAYGRVTTLSIMIETAREMDKIKTEVASLLEDDLIVMDWREMMPELVQSIEADNASGIIMLMILYIVIGFGIFGTIMMMTAEREREFGILVAVGMKKWKLMLVSLYETVFIAFLGAAIGVILSIPVTLYFYGNPILLTGELAESYEALGIEPYIMFGLKPEIFTSQGVVVLVIALVTVVYPLLFIRKLKANEALRA